MEIKEVASAVRAALMEASHGLVDREFLLELVVLAAVAREHLLVIGPPGTAKSEAVRRVNRALGGHYFEYLVGRFTEPGEIFGPIDLRKLREGVVETETRGMLPEAHVVFLDEVFLGSTAILNTLLGVLNERVFRRGHTQIRCPLRVCVGASNALPVDDGLAAFADRFLVRVFLEPVADPMIEDLLSVQEEREIHSPATMEHIDTLAEAAKNVDFHTIKNKLAEGIRILRKKGIQLSDRRIVKTRKLIAAAAVLSMRTEATIHDLWPLLYVIPTAEEQEEAREALKEFLKDAASDSLPSAAEEASVGMKARAERLIRAAEESLLQNTDPGEILRREGILREIDAAFHRDDLPDNLRDLRERLVAGIHENSI